MMYEKNLRLTSFFKTKIEGREAYLYLLLEHQSTPDKLMPFRLLKYMCNIIDHHLTTHGTKHDKIIPLIYPVVIYHGKRKYPFSNNLGDLIDALNLSLNVIFKTISTY